VETKGINDAIHWNLWYCTVLFQYFQFFDEVKGKDEDESEKLEAVIIV
jgi:hypothetical protein